MGQMNLLKKLLKDKLQKEIVTRLKEVMGRNLQEAKVYMIICLLKEG